MSRQGLNQNGNSVYLYQETDGAGSIESFSTGVDDAAGTFKIYGAQSINVKPSDGFQLEIDPGANGNITFQPNGTGTVNISYATENGVPVFGASGAISEIGPLTDGQLIIGSTGSAPVAANLTSTGASIAITNGAGTINLEAGGAMASSFDTDSGTAAPAAGVLTVAGGTNIATSGAGSTVTIDFDGTLPVASGGTGSTTLTDHGIVIGSGTGAVTVLAEAADGEIPIGSTGNDPVLSTITAGTGISVVNASGSITINSTATGFAWSVETGASVAGAVNTGYIANRAGLVTITLPDTAAVGDIIKVTGINTAVGWRVEQNAGETIYYGTDTTTTGAGGYLESTEIRDTVTLVCVVADTDWNVISSIGNITVV